MPNLDMTTGIQWAEHTKGAEMKISQRRKGKVNPETRKQCTQCGEQYLQSVYMFINKKKVKIGIGCPECLKGELNK